MSQHGLWGRRPRSRPFGSRVSGRDDAWPQCATSGRATERPKSMLYPVHVMTRKSFGLMTRKLSVTESQRSAQFLRNLFTQKTERRIGELGTSCVALVVSDVSVHEAP